jgi:cell division protein FtsL
MESVKRFTQAYQHTPWRKQLRTIGTFFMMLAMLVLVAGVYLSVSARTVAVGHEIQQMMREIERMRRSNADLETTLAFLTSTSVMEERARQMGFRPARAEELSYILVPGYEARQEAKLAPPPGLQVVESPPTMPVFTESLIDWLRENAFRPELLGEVQP